MNKVLVGLFFIAFFLRFYLIPQNLFFGPEQGRDFLVIKNIVVDHKPTLIGSKTDVSGVFHGPLFYYMAVIPFFFSSGNPLVVSIFFIFINTLGVFLIFHLGKEIFNKRTGMIAAVLFTFSYTAIVYARWLSNPPLSIPFSVLFSFSFYRYLKGSDKFLILTAITFGLLVQIQLLNLVFFSVILVILLLINYREVLKTEEYYLIVSVLLLFICSFGNFLLFDLKHESLISKSVALLVSGETGFHITLYQAILLTFSMFSLFVTQSIVPGLGDNLVFEVLLLVTAIIMVSKWKQQNHKNELQLLFVWLLIPILLLVILRHDVLPHFFIPLVVPLILLFSFLLDRLLIRNIFIGIVALCIILVVNILSYIRHVPYNTNTLFQENQPGLRYKDQIAVVKRIYTEVHDSTFSIQSYTIPYWSQDAWEYLFWYYGRQYNKYPLPEKAKWLYVIIQDDPNGRLFQENWLKDTVSKWGTKKDEFRYGILTVRKLQVE